MLKLCTHTTAVSAALVVAACGGGGSSDIAKAPEPTTTSSISLPNAGVTIPAATYATGSAELAAWTYLQKARVQCGFGALQQNAKLDAAALAHAKYLAAASVAGSTSYYGHYESESTRLYYTGYAPWDRAHYQGYGTQVAEIVSATTTTYSSTSPAALPSLPEQGEQAMRDLMATVYHLSGAMYHGIDLGLGASWQYRDTSGTRRAEFRFGALNGYQSPASNIKLGTGVLVSYPCAGSSGIQPTFAPASESPNPFPSITLTNQIIGPPIYLKVDAGQVLSVTSSSITTGNTSVATSVLTQANDPQQEIGSHEVFIVPKLALASNTSYQVIVSGNINTTPFSRSFSFSTGD